MAALTLGSFVFFTSLVGVITYVLTRRDDHGSSKGYFLAGRTLTGGFIAGSLLLTNLSTEQLVGLNGSAFADGICVMAWEVVAAMSLVILALFFLPRYLKSGIATVPQFLEERFDDGTRLITSLIFIFAYAVILLPIILYTGATGLSGILNINELTGIESTTTTLWITVWLIGIIGSIYAIFGGLRTVAVSDTINGFGLLVGGILICFFGLQAINGNGMASGMKELYEVHPDKFNSLGRADQSVPFSTLFTGVLLLNLFYWTTNQQIIQRTFGAKNLKEGQKGVIIAGVFKVLAPLILVLPGLIAFHLYGQVIQGEQRLTVKHITDGDVSVVGIDAEGNELFIEGADANKFLGTSNASEAQDRVGQQGSIDDQQFTIDAVLANNVVIAVDPDGKNQYLDDVNTSKLVSQRHKDQAYGMLVREVLPPWLTGFFAAAMVGAILSSYNSVLNSTATLFSLGLYKHLFHPKATERQVIVSGKTFGIIIALAAMSVAPMLAGQDSIFGYLQKMNGLYFIPILAVMIVGMTTRRVPAIAAKIALLAGFAIIAIGYFVPACNAWVNQIHEFHFLGLVFAGLVGLMLLFGVVSPRAEPWVQKSSGEVDLTPWRFAWPLGIGLVVFVLVVYLFFADPSAL